MVNADVVIGEASIELVIALVPGERGAADVLGLDVLALLGAGLGIVALIGEHGGLLNLLDVTGLRQVKDLDTILTADNNPVEFLGEENAVDW